MLQTPKPRNEPMTRPRHPSEPDLATLSLFGLIIILTATLVMAHCMRTPQEPGIIIEAENQP